MLLRKFLSVQGKDAVLKSRSLSLTLSRTIEWTGHLEKKWKKVIETTLARHEFTTQATLGAFYVGSEYQCNILEDAVRKVKIYGKTAIPNGRYRVDFTHSGRFGRMLPILIGVPLFFGIRFHSGNVVEDTDGCFLPGFDKARNAEKISVYRSIEAMDKVILPLFKDPQEEVWLTILGGYSASEMSK